MAEQERPMDLEEWAAGGTMFDATVAASRWAKVLEGRAAEAIPLFEEAVRTGDIEKAGLAIRALRGEG